MIIERLQQNLISWIGWDYAERSGDGQAEQRRHLVIDQRPAYCVELRRCQNVQKGGTADEPSTALAAGQQ